ncbi:MAG: four helix bundle protein [Candidatus Magasanikbacteria bacterium]
MEYDLEERTKKFAKNVLYLLKIIKENNLNKNILSQLIRSVTSVGANYCEANGSSSKKDFRNKIYICKKEVKETSYWIEMLAEVESSQKDELRKLWKESHELTLIFGKISSTLSN